VTQATKCHLSARSSLSDGKRVNTRRTREQALAHPPCTLGQRFGLILTNVANQKLSNLFVRNNLGAESSNPSHSAFGIHTLDPRVRLNPLCELCQQPMTNGQRPSFYFVRPPSVFSFSLAEACAAANRAVSTRNGEQET
jgi:hypothetical protein